MSVLAVVPPLRCFAAHTGSWVRIACGIAMGWSVNLVHLLATTAQPYMPGLCAHGGTRLGVDAVCTLVHSTYRQDLQPVGLLLCPP